jgi:RNA polymerase sigma factor (TIGR02999 family)
MGNVTDLLTLARAGDDGAIGRLFELLYPDLRRIAHARLSAHRRDGAALDTTSLVHECYLKFAAAERLTPEDRKHFLAYTASAMRSITVDAARASLAQRRGGDAQHVTLDTAVANEVPDAEGEILDVHAALDELARLDQRLATVVEMRYFGGMKDEDIAASLGVTDRTVRRDWEKARLLLASALRT